MTHTTKAGGFLCATLLLAAVSVGAAWGAPSLVITGQGGVYDVQGQGFDGGGAMDITLEYDSATLANPRVSQGRLISGAMMSNTLCLCTLLGSVRIA